MAWTRDQIAARAAKELHDGDYVNLGIGIPTLVANFVPPEVHVFFQSENGLIGTGAPPEEGMHHRLLTDAYRAGQRVVRLHSGDPSLYGAITEQMALLDEEHIPSRNRRLRKSASITYRPIR